MDPETPSEATGLLDDKSPEEPPSAEIVHEDEEVDGNLANPFAPGTMALVVHYFVIGVVDGIYGVPTTYYMYDVLDLSADEKYRYDICLSMVECVRFFILLTCVCCPGCIPRAKIFWTIGIILFSSFYATLGLVAQGSIPGLGLSLNTYMTLGLIGKVGENLFSGVLTMELARRTRAESLARRGFLIVTTDLVNEFGSTIGYLLDECFYSNAFDWNITTWSIPTVCWITSLTPIFVILPALYFYDEPPSKPYTIVGIFQECFAAISSPDVFLPFIVIEISTMLDVSNGAVDELLIDGCGVTTDEYLLYKIIKMLFTVAAIWTYRTYFFNTNFVTLVIAAQVFYRVVQMNYTWLLWNNGHNPIYQNGGNCMTYWGVLEISATVVDQFKDEAKDVIKYLFTVMKPGRSGMLNVLMASMDSTYSIVNSCISDELLTIWPTSADDIENYEFKGWIYLQFLTAIVPLPFLVGVSLQLPRSRVEQKKAADLNSTDDPTPPAGLTDESQNKVASHMNGHWVYAAIPVSLWLFYVFFGVYWTYFTDKYTDELHWKNPNANYYGSELFIFIVLTASYCICLVIATLVATGQLTWLRSKPLN